MLIYQLSQKLFAEEYKVYRNSLCTFKEDESSKKGRKKVTFSCKQDLFSMLCIHLFTFNLEINIKYNKI